MNDKKDKCLPIPSQWRNSWTKEDEEKYKEATRSHRWIEISEGSGLTRVECKDCGVYYYIDSSD